MVIFVNFPCKFRAHLLRNIKLFYQSRREKAQLRPNKHALGNWGLQLEKLTHTNWNKVWDEPMLHLFMIFIFKLGPVTIETWELLPS